MKAVKKVTKQEFPKVYIQDLNGIFLLTPSEIEVLAAILIKRQEFVDQGLSGKFLDEFLFSTKTRKTLYEGLGLSYHNFNNYFVALVKKGLIVDNNGEYSLIKQVIPDTTTTIEYKII